jgi:hypothetical protein
VRRHFTPDDVVWRGASCRRRGFAICPLTDDVVAEGRPVRRPRLLLLRRTRAGVREPARRNARERRRPCIRRLSGVLIIQ